MFFTKEEIKARWAKKRAPTRRKAAQKAGFALALEIANNALFDVKTRDGEAYILHPLAVAFNNTNSISKHTIGVLHDVVEDSDWTLEDLREVGFSDRIIQGVDAVTKRSGELYFDFIERCGQAEEDGIDIKLKDLDHNSKANRNPSAMPTAKQSLKQRIYNVSYYYLVGIKTETINPGTPMLDFLLSHQAYAADPISSNELLEKGSSDARRLPTPESPHITTN
ncbi:MAG: hypothetical protein DHS20C02_19400 [Micavibrio sp.]|nr:MAG: hypothetical protein DHS20C02_19400 [Micavibrio sp.]